MTNDWHSKKIEDVCSLLGASSVGLTDSEAQKRLRAHGFNKLVEARPPSRLKIFLRQFKSAFVLILSAALLVTIFFGEYTDAIIIFIAVILNAFIGFIQENRANRALAALKRLVEHRARVVRDGREVVVDASELAPGDIIWLAAGDKVSADARLLEIFDFETNEAALTGESTSVVKSLEILPSETILAERKNMAFTGTIVVRGKTKAIVVETGMRTAMGEIAKLVLETREEPTPLEKQIKKLAAFLAIVIVIANTILFFLGLFTGKSVYEMFLTAVALAVATIPEGLLVSMTVVLAIGMQKLVRENAIIRTLLAAETLGSVSVACVDKTGTLTEGEMRVAGIWTGGELLKKENLRAEIKNGKASLIKILEMILASNNAVIENPNAPLEEWKILADHTEKALLLVGLEAGLKYSEIKSRQLLFDEMPFDSIRKYIVTAHHLENGRDVLYARGAPERILEMSNFWEINGQGRRIDANERARIIQEVENFASQGFRVVALSYKNFTSCDHNILDQERVVLNDLTFIALFLLRDPLRQNTKETIIEAVAAGIKTIMITGDHKNTAQAIGNELGLDGRKEHILTGEELDNLSDEEFEKKVSGINIYARVSPSHKSRIVDALQKSGEVVAMTGDGVNDAPALKSADIGIAVGDGTDVAKETADVVLLDNNLKTIIKAVEGGRVIFDNIRKVVVYLLSDNFHEFVVITLSLLAGLPLPILPAQILWIKLAEDALPSMALAFEKGEKDILKYPPRPKKSPILERPHKFLVFIIGLTTSSLFFSLFVLLLRLTGDLSYTRTIIFAGLTSSTLLYIYSCRSLHQSILKSNPFTNRYLIFSTMMGALLLVAAVYVPGLQKILKTVPLGLNEWLLVWGVSILNVILVEVLKRICIFDKKRSNIGSNSAVVARMG